MNQKCEACGGKTYTGKSLITGNVTVYCYKCEHKTVIKAVA